MKKLSVNIIETLNEGEDLIDKVQYACDFQELLDILGNDDSEKAKKAYIVASNAYTHISDDEEDEEFDNVMGDVLSILSESTMNRAQADYDKWSTVLSEKNKIKEQLKNIISGIEYSSYRNTKEVAKAIQYIIDRI